MCSHPLFDNASINIITCENKTTLPIYANSAVGSRVVHEIQTKHQPWIIRLNECITEPVVSVEIQTKGNPLEISALLDTGSSVCVISQAHLELLGPSGEILPLDTDCVGPDG